MEIHILNESAEVVETIPSGIPLADAIQAAKAKVRESAIQGVTLTAVNEDGENVFDTAFETFLQFIPHGRRIASRMLDRLAHNPAELHMLLSGSPQMANIIHEAIVKYFSTQIALSKEAMDFKGEKRRKFYDLMYDMIVLRSA